MSDMAWWLWLVHLLATAAMFGVIWLVQLVQYPLFGRVGEDSFPSYHDGHVTKITLVVLPLMATELVTAGLLTWLYALEQEATLAWYGSLAFLLVIWLSTAMVQEPLHERLASRFEPTLHQKLVSGNWIRTVSWSARMICVVYAGTQWFGTN